MAETANATATTAAAIGLPTLMWALDHTSWKPPEELIELTIGLSIILLVVAIALWTHLFLKWMGWVSDLSIEATWSEDGKIKYGKARAIIAGICLCVFLIAIHAKVSKLPAAKPGRGVVFVPDVYGQWASDAEIERFREQGRDLVRYSPDRLSGIYSSDGEDGIRFYRGK